MTATEFERELYEAAIGDILIVGANEDWVTGAAYRKIRQYTWQTLHRTGFVRTNTWIAEYYWDLPWSIS